jgi:hypothetical protein
MWFGSLKPDIYLDELQMTYGFVQGILISAAVGGYWRRWHCHVGCNM